MAGWEEKTTLDGLTFYFNNDTEQVQWSKPEELMSEEEKEENKGEWVWVPHKDNMWQPAKVVKKDADESVHVSLQDGSLMKIPPPSSVSGLRVMQDKNTKNFKQEVPLWPCVRSNLRFKEDDLVMLDPVNEAYIIHNLSERYADGEIYTWVGAGHTVLVSVNPYKTLSIYDEKSIELHRNKPPNIALPPHVFDVANDAYDSMAFAGTNQSVLISGESGAGKTEATKQCLKYLATVAGSESKIEEKVLVANPLLEAFGNAKTIRNINSSRFGKWMEVYFDRKTTEMVGSKIINYLLERSRVVYQQANERNYHIFYALFAHEETKQKFGLSTPEDYHYLSQSKCINVPQFNDLENFVEVDQAMDKLEFTPEEKENVLKLTVGVLLLGNMEFDATVGKGKVDASAVKTADVLARVAEMLEIETEELTNVLTFRTITAGIGKTQEKATVPLDKTGAKTASDSLAMGIYGKLFQWLVDRVNTSLGDQDREKNRFLGILDIFGFEIFDNNSFEQLCINYANEKLQQLFNQTTFKEEEQLYISEGIKYTHVEFLDNQVVLDIVEKAPHGILPVLDDEVHIPGGEDKKFMNKIEDYHSGSDSFMTDAKRRFQNKLSFEIVHYAGVVKYDASKFMEKNVDTIFGDMHDALASSKNPLLVTIFKDSDRRIRTLSKQFRGQLDQLMNVLYQTESRFIRCIKPNGEMSANKFVSRSCVEQLRYSGVFEAVDIRKTGYPFRYTHRQFCYRYSCINPTHRYSSLSNLDEDPVSYVKEILETAKQDFSEVQIGKNMVLYRANEYKTLRLLRNLALETLIPRGQGVIRGGLLRNYATRLKQAEANIEEVLVAADDLAGLRDAVEAAGNAFEPSQLRLFNYQPRNLAVAKKMIGELDEWLSLEKEMKKLAELEDPNPEYEALKALDTKITDMIEKQTTMAKEAHIDFYGRADYRQPKLTKAQQEYRVKLKEQIKICTLGILDRDVTAALESMQEQDLMNVIERAEELNHDTEDIQKARELLEDLQKLEKDAYFAMQCVSRTMLDTVLETADGLKQTNTDIIKKVQALRDLPEKEFVQEEYRRAVDVGDDARRKHREIRLLELKYEGAGAQYSITSVPRLRPRHEYVKSPKKQEAFLVFEKKLHNSLTKPASENGEVTPESKKATKEFKKKAKLIFKHIMIYMGDKKNKEPDNSAAEILRMGVDAHRGDDNDTLGEIYMQIIKQLRNNPTEKNQGAGDARNSLTTRGTSFQNGLQLLGMCLVTFPPSTIPFSTEEVTFDDYIAVYIQDKLNFGGSLTPKKFMSALHNTKYAENKVTNPGTPAGLRSDLAKLEGKFSIDLDQDSGPKEENYPLYEAANIGGQEEVGVDSVEGEGEGEGEGEE